MKYHNRKSRINGIRFDSKKEACRYQELRLAEKAGVIKDLQRQVKFVLIPAQREKSKEVYQKGENKGKPKPGKLIERECSYYADFVYIDTKTGRIVVEDTKGMRTADYIIKRKLMLYVHSIRVKET